MPKSIAKILECVFFNFLPLWGISSFYGLLENKYISPIFLIIGFFLIFSYKENSNAGKRKKIFFGTLSIMYSVFYVLGTLINIKYEDYYYNFLTNNIYSLLLWIYSFSVIFYFIVIKFVSYLEHRKYKPLDGKYKKFLFPFCFIIIFISWTPYFVNFFPGLMSPDSLNQWCQSIGECVVTNHHPVFHTLFIKIFSSFGLYAGKPNLGLAFHSVTQMFIMAAIFSYEIFYLFKEQCNKYIIFLSLIFFSTIPIFGFYSITMWKDVLFGGFVLIFVIQIRKFVYKNKLSTLESILSMVSVLLVSLFRSNGIYIVALVFLVLLVGIKRKQKDILILFSVPFLIFSLIKYPIFNYFDIKEGKFVENVAIPLKQMVGIVDQGLGIDNDDYEYITKLIPQDIIKEKYNPYSIDPIKFDSSFDNKLLENNKKIFFSTWVKLLGEHPITFIQTYLRSTYGFWYPEAQGYIVHQWPIATNDYSLSSRESFDNLGITKYFANFYNLPLIKYLTSDAFYLWAIVFAIFVSLYRKKYKVLFVLSVPMFVFLTIIIATPISYQPRYTFALYVVFPLVMYVVDDVLRKNPDI